MTWIYYLATGTDIGLLREDIGELSLALVTPLGTKDDGDALGGHASKL